METKRGFERVNIGRSVSFLIPIVFFWFILVVKIPYSLSQYFHIYSIELFLLVLILYYLSFRLPERYRILIGFGLTVALFALTLSYKWTSGYSDNKVIAGFLPYKDGGGYYSGANLILNGLPLGNALQSSWRPLFPGFLSSMLFLMDGNLKWVLAVLVLLAAIGSYFSSYRIFVSWGALPAGLFITFLYFYIQPLIGLTMTELLGFTVGCFAFLLLWNAFCNLNTADLLLGLLALVLALSVRAGTFFMLPLIAFWAGRVFGRKTEFSFRVFGISLGTILISYFVFNTLYVRLIGVPEGVAFGNFAYSLYGQVHGGTGWHSAIEELGTTKPSIIYRASLQFFRDHPFSLLIGIVKSYRDFFLLRDGGIFVFNTNNWSSWTDLTMWGISIFLMVLGLIRLLMTTSLRISALLLAGFAGILLSIPFLPPIDGGSRFYASSIPFFFMLPVMGTIRSASLIERDEPIGSFQPEMNLTRTGTIILLLLIVAMPVMILNLSSTPAFTVPDCSDAEDPFVIKSYSNSYVDLIHNNNSCGLVPEICLRDFEKNSMEKSVDDFYQELYSLAAIDKSNARVIPALNLIDGKLSFFYFAQEEIPAITSGLISGCAVKIETSNRSIYQVQFISPDGN